MNYQTDYPNLNWSLNAVDHVKSEVRSGHNIFEDGMHSFLLSFQAVVLRTKAVMNHRFSFLLLSLTWVDGFKKFQGYIFLTNTDALFWNCKLQTHLFIFFQTYATIFNLLTRIFLQGFCINFQQKDFAYTTISSSCNNFLAFLSEMFLKPCLCNNF